MLRSAGGAVSTEDVRRVVAAATPAPWVRLDDKLIRPDEPFNLIVASCNSISDADAALIAMAPTALALACDLADQVRIVVSYWTGEKPGHPLQVALDAWEQGTE